jgi:hypothetical protein
VRLLALHRHSETPIERENTMKHWHVSRHPDDEDVFVCNTLFDALGYAAEELRCLADGEYECITGFGELELYREAYESFVRSESYDVLRRNAQYVADQHKAPIPKRAVAFQRNEYALSMRAMRLVGEISERSPLQLWPCELVKCQSYDLDLSVELN